MGNSDSKAAFRQNVERLLNENIPVDDDAFWDGLLTSNLSTEEVFELVMPDDVRQLKNSQRLNLSSMLKRILRALRVAVDRGSSEQLSKNDIGQISTCVRLLTRLMPFIMEPLEVGRPDNFVRELLWRPGGYVPAVQQEFQRRVDSGSGGVVEEGAAAGEAAKEEVDWSFSNIMLGYEMLLLLQRLLFLKGYCVVAPGEKVNEAEIPSHKVDPRFVWKGGVGTALETPTQASVAIFKARTEVLRCILVCLSGTLYQTAEEYQRSIPTALRIFTRGDLPYTATLFCSLMGSVFSFDPVGYGIPFGGLVSSAAPEEEMVNVALQLLCVLVDFNPAMFGETSAHGASSATVMFNGSKASSQASEGSQQGDAPNTNGLTADGKAANLQRTGSSGSPRNVYRTMLSSLRKENEIDLVFEGFVRLLSTIPNAKKAYLSSPVVSCHQELLILLWHLVSSNPAFVGRLCGRLDSNKLLVPIVYLLLEASNCRKSPQQHPEVSSVPDSPSAVQNNSAATATTTEGEVDGEAKPLSHTAASVTSTTTTPTAAKSVGSQEHVGLLHVCSFILLVLSSERDFAVRLNDPYLDRFPLDVPLFQGCYADLLALVIYRVVLDSMGVAANDSLIDMLLTALCNVSAYIKSFCLEACVKLLVVLDRFSRPSWLFKVPYHYHSMFFLLDAFNNLIQYQYEGNMRLVYSILRQKDLFLRLQNLQLPANYLEQEGSESDQAPTITQEGEVLVGACAKGEDQQEWRPTSEWFEDWKSKLPLQTLVRLISCLLPMVENECQQRGLIDQEEVMEYLQHTTMVGLLPVPHAIIIRNYHPNAYTALWFSSYMWGVVFSRTQSLALFDWKKVRFIAINN